LAWERFTRSSRIPAAGVWAGFPNSSRRIELVLHAAEAILHREPVTLKELNEWYLDKYLTITRTDKSSPFYGNIILPFENNKSSVVKEERIRKL
jgi:hypothetical protein